MKLKDLLDKVEELATIVTGELTVKLTCDCGLDKDIDLKSKSSVPQLDVTVYYPVKEKNDDD